MLTFDLCFYYTKWQKYKIYVLEEIQTHHKHTSAECYSLMYTRLKRVLNLLSSSTIFNGTYIFIFFYYNYKYFNLKFSNQFPITSNIYSYISESGRPVDM